MDSGRREGSARRVAVRGVALLLGAALAVVPGIASARPEPAPAVDDSHEDTQRALEAIVESGIPGVLARVDDATGTWHGAAGVADVDTARPRLPVDHFRIGSITKSFVATVLLQLEAEGRLSLDDSVETWLPGVLAGNGYDGTAITVRQLLNHTSGVFDILDDREFVSQFAGESFFEHRYDEVTPQRLLDIALAHPPTFPPGTDWAYSNTNYTLAGLVIEAVTGRSYADEVTDRIVEPLRLRSTRVPGSDPDLPAPSGRGYSTLFVPGPDATVYDVTSVNPAIAGAGGEMVSSVTDLNRFFTALLRGDLLPPAQQRELFTGVDAGGGSSYGLGVRTYPLSCRTVWGNDGEFFGSETWTVGTGDGGHVMSMNVNGDWGDDIVTEAALEAEFC